MRAFVTGGTGFIGRRLVQRLVERGYDIVCVVRRPENAGELQEMGVTLVTGDITDRESMHEINRDRFDEVWEKLQTAGAGSLSQREQAFLDRFSAEGG